MYCLDSLLCHTARKFHVFLISIFVPTAMSQSAIRITTRDTTKQIRHIEFGRFSIFFIDEIVFKCIIPNSTVKFQYLQLYFAYHRILFYINQFHILSEVKRFI
jgi:hypothetical protein